jgi:hypothetical protein
VFSFKKQKARDVSYKISEQGRLVIKCGYESARLLKVYLNDMHFGKKITKCSFVETNNIYEIELAEEEITKLELALRLTEGERNLMQYIIFRFPFLQLSFDEELMIVGAADKMQILIDELKKKGISGDLRINENQKMMFLSREEMREMVRVIGLFDLEQGDELVLTNCEAKISADGLKRDTRRKYLGEGAHKKVRSAYVRSGLKRRLPYLPIAVAKMDSAWEVSAESNNINRFRHPNVLSCRLKFSTGKTRLGITRKAYLVSNKARGDLFDFKLFLQRSDDVLGKWEMILGIVQGLRHMHDHNFVHYDLKPENILVMDDDRCVIGDLAGVVANGARMRSSHPEFYPEVFASNIIFN